MARLIKKKVFAVGNPTRCNIGKQKRT